MQLRWTSTAAEDLENIANYLFEKTPENAPRLVREIYNATQPEELPKPWACRQERRDARISAALRAVHHRLSCQRRCRAYRARPTQFPGLATMNRHLRYPSY
ncbi:MAG: hypothetical protein QOF56_4107 [Acidobacteriaceae bacterium]|jgi:plasmid stabilization system protein ParE|nr:hypothetical protein [Acidobacteriaceae bacterium]